MLSITLSKAKTRAALVVSRRLTALISIMPEGEGYRLTGLDEFQSHGADAIDGRWQNIFLKNRTVDLIAGRTLFVKMLRLPKMSKAEAIKTLAITQKESIPFNLEESFHDVWILNEPDHSQTMDALMVAVKNEDIRDHFGRLGGAPCAPGAISIAPVAIAALIGMSKMIDTSRPTLFLDIAESVIGLHIFKDRRLIFTREIQFGVDEIVKSLLRADLPDGTKIVDHKEAIAIIENEGVPIEGEWDSQTVPLPLAQNHILPPMEKIGKEIRRTIEYFRHNTGSPTISQGYLVGCGAIIKGMPAHVAKHIGVPCAPYNPLDDFLLSQPSIQVEKEKIGPLIAVAVGLAIDNGEKIDLIRSKPFRSMRSGLSRSPRTAASLIFAIICVGIVWGGASFEKLNGQIEEATAEVEKLESDIEPIDYSRERLKKIDKEIIILEREISSYPQARGAGYNWTRFFEEIGGLTPGKIALTRLTIDFSNEREDRPRRDIATFEGIVKGENKEKLIAISELIYRLKRSPFFESAQIKGTSDKRINANDNGLTRFEVKALLGRTSSMMALSPGDKDGEGS